MGRCPCGTPSHSLVLFVIDWISSGWKIETDRYPGGTREYKIASLPSCSHWCVLQLLSLHSWNIPLCHRSIWNHPLLHQTKIIEFAYLEVVYFFYLALNKVIKRLDAKHFIADYYCFRKYTFKKYKLFKLLVWYVFSNIWGKCYGIIQCWRKKTYWMILFFYTSTNVNKKVYLFLIKPVILATVVKSDQKAPFSLATTPRCRGGCYSFLWIAPLYPWYVPFIAECYARRYKVPFFKSLVGKNLGLNPGLPDHWQTLCPLD